MRDQAGQEPIPGTAGQVRISLKPPRPRLWVVYLGRTGQTPAKCPPRQAEAIGRATEPDASPTPLYTTTRSQTQSAQSRAGTEDEKASLNATAQTLNPKRGDNCPLNATENTPDLVMMGENASPPYSYPSFARETGRRLFPGDFIHSWARKRILRERLARWNVSQQCLDSAPALDSSGLPRPRGIICGVGTGKTRHLRCFLFKGRTSLFSLSVEFSIPRVV